MVLISPSVVLEAFDGSMREGENELPVRWEHAYVVEPRREDFFPTFIVIQQSEAFGQDRACPGIPGNSQNLSRSGQNELKKIKRMSESSFVCPICKQTHQGIPLSFAADIPDMYANMPDAEHSSRALINSDQCIIDDTWFFIRGCLEIPVIETGEVFLWGVWASVKEEVFNELSESWEETGRETPRGPFKGRLANSLSVYPETLNLKLRLIVQAVGQRPLFVIEEDHPLTTAQQHGMSQHEVAELGHLLLRIQGGSSRSSQ